MTTGMGVLQIWVRTTATISRKHLVAADKALTATIRWTGVNVGFVLICTVV